MNKNVLYIIILFLIISECKGQSNNNNNDKNKKIWTSILLDDDGKPCYIAHLEIGSPKKSYKLQISFEESNIILFKSKQNHESLTLIEYKGIYHEIIYIGSSHYYIPIDFNYNKRYNDDDHFTINSDCDGIIGFSDSSLFWKLFGHEITFSPDFIELGKPNTLNHHLKVNDKNINDFKIKCKEDVNSFCAIESLMDSSSNEKEKEKFVILFNPQLTNTYLPNSLYERYTNNKNIYNYARENWNDIEFHIPSKENEYLNNISNTFETVKLSLKKSHFIFERKLGIKELLINKLSDQKFYNHVDFNEGDNFIIIGMNFIDNKIIYKNNLENYAIFYALDTSDHYSAFSLVVFISLFFLFLRWKLTDSNLKLNSKNINETIYTGINFLFEITGILITTISYSVPTTQNVLKYYPTLNIFTSINLILCILCEITCLIYLTYSNKFKNKKYIYKNLNTFYQINLIRNISHDTILLIGMWLILVERTKIDLAILPTVLINIYIFYNLSFYLFQLLLYNFFKDRISFRRRDSALFNQEENGFIVIFYALTIYQFIYYNQIIFSTYYFVIPYFELKAPHLDDINVQLTIIIYLYLFIGALWKTRLYIRKHLVDTLKFIAKYNKLNNQKIKEV
jgi:hypothetical protein